MSMDDYANAKKLADKASRRAALEHHDPYLCCLDALLKDRRTAGETHLGVMDIPLRMVVGTVTDGRRRTFADNFMPITSRDSEFARKWASLYDIQEEEGIRDPITCYEYMHRFYVAEGNKRASVLKYLDVPSIEADVTRIMPVKTDEKDVECYYEFLDFFRVAPFYDIEFSKPGSYAKFASLIGQNLTDPWPSDLINTVRGAYFRFSSVFKSKAPSQMNITIGDAFLLYLMIYQFDSLLDYSKDSIARRLEGIWNELLVENNGQITLHENPEPESSVGFLQNILNRPPVFTEKHPLKAAFLYEKDLENSGWANDHEIGRIALEHYYEGFVKTWYYENCAEDQDIQKAIDNAAQRGADVVFTTSASEMRATLRAAIKYPKIRFANCSVFLPHNAVRTYNIREYEVKFLMGALGAVYSGNHKLGYLASRPAYGVLAGINAFAIGAAMIDPEVKVYVTWAGMKDSGWKKLLEDNEITTYSGLDLSLTAGNKMDYGLVKVNSIGDITNLALPVRNWTRYYERIVKSILNGTWDTAEKPKKDQALNEWWGLSAGVIDINLTGQLSYYSRKMIDLFRSGLITGTLDPFQGELHSQNGFIQAAGSPRLSSSAIITMDWLNDNVIGRIPVYEELNEITQKQLEDDGVIKGADK